jgi:hypothetical protein
MIPENIDSTSGSGCSTPPCSLSSAALKVWLECEKDTPFFCRRSIDKSCYEVGRQTNEDWRECISEDRIFLGTFATEEEAQSVYNEHRIKWIWSEILQANAGYINIYHEDKEYHIELHVGVQSFKLDYSNEDYESAKWMAKQFAHALNRMVGNVRLYGTETSQL